ncbi:MAG TPA: prolipoprotein diacylglyceryl transferase [Acidimicrobiia bacterium]|jgi:prolipoprotein diacylglyceryl transferase
MLASIPSPPFNTIPIGPLEIHFYGLLIGIGAILAVVIGLNRYTDDPDERQEVERILVRAIVIGFAGARLAYVSTHLGRFEGEWWKVIAIWEGGLALFGGLTAGTLTAVWMIRRRNGDQWKLLDAAAVGIPVAQAIGRWGNYFNQELFGTPSNLPWAVEIDQRFRPEAYADAATFHPTFLYESLWNIAIVVPALLWTERRFDLPRGGLFFVYAGLYGVGRFGLELIRTDTTFRLLGLSRNGWVSLLIVTGAVVAFALRRRGSARVESDS